MARRRLYGTIDIGSNFRGASGDFRDGNNAGRRAGGKHPGEGDRRRLAQRRGASEPRRTTETTAESAKAGEQGWRDAGKTGRRVAPAGSRELRKHNVVSGSDFR